jgi:3-oxoacyl-[acyl-carrier protein] reductase
MNAREQSDQPTALVTGGAQGVGFGVARALAAAGRLVVLADIDLERAERAAGELRMEGLDAIATRLDVADAGEWEDAVDSVIRRRGRIDILVNNAGISPRGTIDTTDEPLWDRTMSINLKGAWLGIRACLPHLRRSKGAIINIGSTRATRPMPGLFAYVASKAGLIGLTRQTAVELLRDGVACNMIAPGWVDTPGERIIQADHGRPDFPEGLQNLISIDDVGAAAAYLASGPGRRVTGVVLYVDSGLHLADDAAMVHLPEVARDRYHTPGKTL